MTCKRVLLVSYFFPPLGGSAVFRVAKTAKYLSDDGWQVRVLTVKEIDYLAYDNDLINDVPPTVEVLRAGSVDPSRISRLMRLGLNRLRPRGSEGDRSRTGAAGIYNLIPGALRSRLGMWMFPDERAGWIPFAVAAALRSHRRAPFNVILSTSPPISAHIVALIVSRLTRAPWVSDFRDAWTGSPFYRPLGDWQRRFALGLERRIVLNSARVVVTTRSIGDMLLQQHPEMDPEKLVVIPNGFDAADLEHLDQVRAGWDGRLVITHAGSLYAARSGELFLKGLARLLAAEPGLRQGILIRFIGNVDAATVSAIDDLGLRDVVEVRGYRPHRECLGDMVGSDVLLLLTSEQGEGSSHVPAKLYEYMALGRPVLALAKEGEVAALVRQAGGWVADPGNIEAITVALGKVLVSWRRGGNWDQIANRHRQVAMGFDRRLLSRQFGQLLSQVIEQRGVGGEKQFAC